MWLVSISLGLATKLSPKTMIIHNEFLFNVFNMVPLIHLRTEKTITWKSCDFCDSNEDLVEKA